MINRAKLLRPQRVQSSRFQVESSRRPSEQPLTAKRRVS